MTKILALDTSSDMCSVSLCIDDTFFSLADYAPRKHAQLLLPMIKEVLEDAGAALADLDAIAFGRGPGSFTGLRIAAGVVQGLAYGVGCSVVPVSNLKAMSMQANLELGAKQVLVAIDARMDEVYWSECQIDSDGDVNCLSGEHVSKPELIEVTCTDALVGVGSGFEYIERMSTSLRTLLDKVDVELRPHAETIARLAVKEFQAGAFVSPEKASPIYIRDEVAWKKLPGRE